MDRAFGRLSPLPAPPGFTMRVMRAAAAARPVRVSLPWLSAALACVLLVGILGFWAGQVLVGGGLLDLLAAAATDPALLGVLPGGTLLALLEAVPWLELLGLAAALGAFAAAVRRLGGPNDAGGGAERPLTEGA